MTRNTDKRIAFRGMSVRDRIHAQTSIGPGGCWLWATPTSRTCPYGRLAINGVATKAHRASYVEFVGPIPPGDLVLHRCDTPLCVNPDHLFLGSARDNAHDCASKGRNSRPRGETNGSAKLTWAQVDEIRRDQRTQVAVAADYGIDPSQVSNIRRGKSWIK